MSNGSEKLINKYRWNSPIKTWFKHRGSVIISSDNDYA